MSNNSHRHNNEHNESSMSSLSAGLSAYNASEPKPLASATNSVMMTTTRGGGGDDNRSRVSSSSNRGPPPPPPPPRPNGGGGTVASSSRSRVTSSGRPPAAYYRDNDYDNDDDYDDDGGSRYSSATERLVGVVRELTNGEENDINVDRRSYRGGGASVRGGGGSTRGGGGGGSQYRDPDGGGSTYSRGSRGGGGGGGSRYNNSREPDGMSHEYGADDPDGRQYAPTSSSSSSSRGGGGGGGGIRKGARGGPMSVTRGGGVHAREGEDGSYRSGSGGGRGGGVYEQRRTKDDEDEDVEDDEDDYDEDEDDTMGGEEDDEDEDESVPENGSYYSRDSSRGGGGSTARTGKSGKVVPYADENDDESRASSMAKGKGKGGGGGGHGGAVDPSMNPKRAMWWWRFSKFVTICVPDRLIRKDDAEAKQAWREKVAICFCVFMASVFFVGAFGFIPILLCRERTVYTLPDVQERIDENWIALNGYVYDVTGLFERHPTGPAGIEAFLHDDASRLFPRIPPAALPSYCVNPAKFEDNEELQNKKPVCSAFTEEDVKNGLPCHDFVAGINATAKYMGEFEKGVQAHDEEQLINSAFTFWVSIHDRVYNVTDYINNIRNEQTKQIEKDHPLAYLEQKMNNLVINKLNEDATELFVSLFPDDKLLGCMDELFYVGIIDTRFDVVCFILNIIMYFLLAFVAFIMVAQMFCSLMYVAKNTRTYTDEDTQDQVIIMVPCYNEGGKELIKTIDSVLATTYPEENKVIFIIADGVVTGAGQDLSTPEHLAEILGFEMDPQNDELYEYDSIGLLTTNRARVYHGYYEVEDRSLKYLVVVKHGLPMEQTGSAKPGNRGKRDSQLIVMGYFNRVYHGRELTELDAAIEDALIDLNMQSDDMRLLMTIDADTRVEEMSVTHMTYAMNQNDRILALCGETKVDNKWQSWVTMMQVFEYYNNHHMKKAFESAFGCVTCLPGCFTMYRILNDDGKPLLADDHVYAEYLRNDIDSLHEQNLFHLGEDRMLTTLLLHFFSGMFLSYVPEAQCFTIVPHSMKILLSQRRRWINSTYHNLLELTKVKTMCGVCCCSMKTVVYLDLIACMILPASTVYAVYLIFLVAAGKTQFSLLLLVLYGLIIGVQIVVFILRSRYDFLFWFIYFTIIGVPVFYFVLPLYAFWHMDDFSWGETRKVAAMKESFAKPPPPVEEEDDESTESDDESEEYSRSRSRRSGR